MDVHETRILVQAQLMEGICQFYSGAVQTIVHGMKELAKRQLRTDISQFYSGAVPMDVLRIEFAVETIIHINN